MTNQYRRDTINKASSKDASARDTSAQNIGAQNIGAQNIGAQNTGARVIGRRQLLSTFALGSTALVGMVSLKNGAGVTGNGVGGTGVSTARVTSYRVHDTSVGGTSVHDAIFSPAAAQEQETTTFTFPDQGVFNVDSTGRIVSHTGDFTFTESIYWQPDATSGLLLSGVTIADRRFAPYLVNEGSTSITKHALTPSPPNPYEPDQIRPRTLTSGDETLIVYPVTGISGLGQHRLMVGYYAKASGSNGDWQFIPYYVGAPIEQELEVLVAVDGADGMEIVQPFSIGRPSERLDTNTRERTIPPAGLLADDTRTGAMSRQTFDAALDAREIDMNGVAADENEYDLRRIFDFTPVTTASTDEPVTVAPGPTTSTIAPTNSTTAPTTSTNVATTANATIAPTTTLVSTTVGAATMAPTTTLVSTTGNGTTVTGATTGGPTIAGELSVRGAINAQGNIGANVARSLSGRLSSFRTRNRPRR